MGGADSIGVACEDQAQSSGAQACSRATQAASGGAQAQSRATQADMPGAQTQSVSLGVDIVEIARMRAILQRSPSFTRRVFSQEEQAYCNKYARPEVHYATRFAAKEAVLKALGTGFSGGVNVRDVEVVMSSKGSPEVRLHGRAQQIAQELGFVEMPLSLSHTHTEAVACAMALTAQSAGEPHQTPGAASELVRRFKQARSLLDDLPQQGSLEA